MKQEIWDAYPELFHYTSPAGLEGILRTQTLWATHAAFLNDVTELGLFRKRLPEFLRDHVESALLFRAENSDAHLSELNQEGGPSVVASGIARELAQSMHDVLVGADGQGAILDFFIVSFCTVPSKQALVSEHGLLSQWRGYGHHGGYALVFDTAGFKELLTDEENRWQVQLIFGDVAYSNDTPDVLIRKLGEDIGPLAHAIGELVKTPNSAQAREKTFQPFISCVARYKHWGYYEEHEVRLIASVNGARIINESPPTAEGRAAKPRHHFNRRGTEVPCLHLFENVTDGAKRTLPISRIIVGPHHDQERRYLGVKSLLAELGLTIPVTKSEIPYVEQT
jgi:hypothetical protein